MKTLFIHVGLHKTGTKAMQLWIRKNESLLLDRGVYIPQSGILDENSGHHRIAWEMRGDERNEGKQKYIKELIYELQCCILNKALISSEDFEYISVYPERLLLFQNELESIGWKVKYFAYFRKPTEYAVSLYHQLKKHECGLNYLNYIYQIFTTGIYKTKNGWFFDFNYKRLKNRWEQTFSEPLEAICYETHINNKGIIHPMLEFIEIRVTETPAYSIERVNERSRSEGIINKTKDYFIKKSLNKITF